MGICNCGEFACDHVYPWKTVGVTLNTEGLNHSDLSMWYESMEELRQKLIMVHGLPEHAFELIPYSC